MAQSGPLHNIEKIEGDLREAADQLRANSGLASSDYFMPVLGVIFLRHASNRFDAATRAIEADQAAGKMPKREVIPQDYLKRRALWLPPVSRWRFIVAPPEKPHDDIRAIVTGAMEAIEAGFPPLNGVLPKEYGVFEKGVLDILLRIFNREMLER